MPKITPSWVFDHQAEEAASFYISVFGSGKITHRTYFEANDPGAEGTLATVTFELLGQEYVAANGGPEFTFGQGLSLYIDCDSQQEMDAIYDKLSAGGEQQPCGWLVDKFGVSWQVASSRIQQMMNDPDQEKAHRMLKALYDMTRIDMQTLEDAFAGK